MKINFIIPGPAKTGGIAVVLEHASRLRKAGHDVRVYAPIFPYRIYSANPVFWKRSCFYALDTLLSVRGMFRGFSWFRGDVKLQAAPFIHRMFVRDADVVVATAWPTAYDVAALPASKGARFYFLQGHEIWNGEPEKVERSYRLPLHLLTIAPWLTRLVREKSGREITAEIHNGVDLESFRPPASRGGTPSILMMYHTQKVKGISDGLALLHRVHARYPDVRIRMFGMYPFAGKPAYIEYTRDPSRERLVELYQKSDIYLSPSRSEGWQLPPMEAMACGCAVVATRVGCIPVLEKNGNLLGAEPGDLDALHRNVEGLIENPALLRETARKGLQTIQEYGWDAKSREFEKALNSVPRETG